VSDAQLTVLKYQVVRMWMKLPAISRWRPLEKLKWTEVVSNSSRLFATAPISKVKLGVQGVCFELGQVGIP